MTVAFDVEDFKQIKKEESQQAVRLADILMRSYNPNFVVDIGCATGLYLKPFMDRGIKVYGVEPAYQDAIDAGLDIPDSCMSFRYFPTNAPMISEYDPDLTLCLEVLEHVSEDKADGFVEGLCSLSDVIVFSAGSPGQGGKGHINCQPKEYWMQLFEEYDFLVDLEATEKIVWHMRQGYHMGWLVNNLMVLKRKDDLDMTEEEFDAKMKEGIPAEVMVTDPNTGGMKASKPAQESMIDPLALSVLAEVAGMGAEKYDDYNYLKGYKWSLSYDSLQRHIKAAWGGEDIDPESGLPHAAHAAWHGLALLSFYLRGLGTDNRPGQVLGWDDEKENDGI